MATLNININENDVININVVTMPKSKVSKKELYDKLYKDLVHRSNNSEHPFWYEVFYDFADEFDEKIYPIVKDMKYEDALCYCWGCLSLQNGYYFSEEYYQDLNEMLRKS